MQQKLKSLGVDGWLRATGLIRTKQELMAQYVTLEEFFLRRSIEKAIRMDEHDNESITSSCLEDSFFIFKKWYRQPKKKSILLILFAVSRGQCLLWTWTPCAPF